MQSEIKCTKCDKPTTNPLNYKCPTCNQPLTATIKTPFTTKQIHKNTNSHWRYKAFFPYINKNDIITLGEGWTPLTKLTHNTYLKQENLNPTGTFKDRGTTTLISAIHKQIKKTKTHISEDSSGNAGASIAAYAANAKLKAEIYVPKNVAGPKFRQIQFYGAKTTKIAGNRNQIAKQAQKPEKNKFYIGHILHPLFRDGIRTLAYEIAEQLNWQAPEHIYLPVSAGTLLLGIISGFKHLVKSNILENTPKIVACQTKQVSPLYHNLKGIHYKPPKTIKSVADALVSVNPPLLNIMVKSLMEIKGDAVIVDECEILDAFNELARKGFFVEPSSAVAYAAYTKQLKNKEITKDAKTVIILTGTGLKTTLKPK